MTGSTFEQLDAQSTEELREQAFAKAREHHDLGFFIDLFRHLPSAGDYDDSDDGSLGVHAGVDEAIALWRQLRGHQYGEEEPLIRARFIDYLLKPVE